MQNPIRKATVIVRLWAESDQIDANSWRGTAEIIGSKQSIQFQTLNEFNKWLHQELAKIEAKTMLKNKPNATSNQ